MNEVKHEDVTKAYQSTNYRDDATTVCKDEQVVLAVVKSSNKWRPFLWFVAVVDIVVSVAFLWSFYKNRTYGFVPTGNENYNYVFMFARVLMLVGLIIEFFIGTLLVVILTRKNGLKALNFCTYWICCSFVVDFCTGMVIITGEPKPRMLLVFIFFSLVVFRLVADRTVKKFCGCLEDELDYWGKIPDKDHNYGVAIILPP